MSTPLEEAHHERICLSGTNSLLERITGIPKSSGSFSEKIEALAQILKIPRLELSTLRLLEDDGQKIKKTFDPVDEWALRWLLKSFNSVAVDPTSPCLNISAWILLGSVLSRLPTAVISRHLAEFSFLSAVDYCVSWLMDHCHRKPGNGTSGAGSRESSSSATLLDSSDELGQSSRKRKRDEEKKISASKATSISRNEARKLLIAVCRVVEQIVALTNDSRQDIEGYPSEHMMAVLKSSPEHTAKIMSSILSLCASIILDGALTTEVKIHDDLFYPIVLLWKLRNRREGHDLLYFAEFCLSPALLVLTKCGMKDTSKDQNRLKSAVEDIVLAEILIPIRRSFMQTANLSKEETTDPLVNLLESMHHDEGSPKQHELLPLLFDLSVRTAQRETRQQRSTENAWLQHFFSRIAQVMSLNFDTPPNPTTEKGSITALKSMMRSAISHNVSFTAPLPTKILAQFSGLSDVDVAMIVDWELVGLCMELDTSALIKSTLRSADIAGETAEPEIPLLDLMLRTLTKSGFRSIYSGQKKNPSTAVARKTRPLVYSKDYNIILDLVLIPLLNYHIQTRSLLSFLHTWYHQLTHWHQTWASIKYPGLTGYQHRSVWEDERFLEAVRTHIESDLTFSQISSLLDELSKDFERACEDVLGAESASCLVLFDTIFAGIQSAEMISKVQGVATTLSMDLMKRNSESDNGLDDTLGEPWRGWRCLCTIQSGWLKLPQSPEVHFEVACPKFSDSVEDTAHLSRFLVFWYFVLRRSRDENGDPENRDNVDTKLGKVISASIEDLAETFAARAIAESGKLLWNGDFESINSPETLLVACMAALMAKPFVLESLEIKARTALCGAIYTSARAEYYGVRNSTTAALKGSDEISIGGNWLWKRLCQSALTDEHSNISLTLRETRVTGLLAPSLDSAWSFEFAATRILEDLPLLLERQDQHLVEAHTCVLLVGSKGASDSPLRELLLTILIRVMVRPHRGLKMLESPQLIWNFSEQFDLTLQTMGAKEMRNIFLWRRVIQLIVNYIVATLGDERSQEYLRKLHDIVKSALPEQGNPRFPSRSFVIVTVLKAMSTQEGQQLLGGDSSIKKLRIQHCSEHFDALRHLEMYSERERDSHTALIFQTLCVSSDLLESISAEGGIPPAMDETSPGSRLIPWEYLKDLKSQLADHALTTESNVDCESSPYDTEYALALCQKIWSLQPQTSSILDFLSSPLRRIDSPLGFRLCPVQLRLFKKRYSTLSIDSQAKAIHHLVQGANLRSESILLHLHRIIGDNKFESSRPPSLCAAKVTAFSELCTSLQEVDTTEWRILLKLRCLDLMLRKEAWTISQWHVDSLLSMMGILTSKYGPDVPAKSAGKIFTAVCRLYGTLLSVHRIKLGGRYHLILQSLQGLLRCLFIPHGPSIGIEAPPWLRQEDPLDESHAALYTRIITSLADPSVAAVSRGKIHRLPQLNDETKKARRIAGQYLQYLILEICQCLLRGKISPEIREALNPGLYAIFDAMSPDVTKAINAALDASGRAIFKALYDDYQAFGKWGGE